MGVYIVCASVLAVCMTIVDKARARDGGRRISERTLFLIAALGGSAAMLVTMRLIRHKTRRANFMVGLPVIAGVQLAAYIFLVNG